MRNAERRGRVREERVLGRFVYDHPVFDAAATAAQARHAELDGERHTYFCGAYWRNGFHEDGVVSALEAVRHFNERVRHAELHLRGRVSHARKSPVAHAFGYRLFMLYLDLTELPKVFAGRWLWSTRAARARVAAPRRLLGDPREPLDESVRRLVAAETGRRPAGPIRLLTHLRYFGYGFNPVSFYYCFDSGGTAVETIVAEVSNTPWGERHCYVLDGAARNPRRGSRRRKPCTSRRSCRWTWRMSGRSRRPQGGSA